MLVSGTDMLSVFCIERYPLISASTGMIVSFIFFLFLSLTPFIFCYYCYFTISSTHKYFKLYISTTILIYLVYFGILIANFWTGCIFNYTEEGYIRGPLKFVPFIITTLVIFITEIVIFINHKTMSRRMFVVFIIYPAITLLLALFQLINPSYLMSGTSGLIPLILIYVAIQTDRIEIDFKTGLKTEQHLMRMMKKNHNHYQMIFLHLDNLGILQEKVGTTELDIQLLYLVRLFRLYISGDIYRSGSKFIFITNKFNHPESSLQLVFYKFESTYKGLSSPVDFEYTATALSIPEHAATYDEVIEIFRVFTNQFEKTSKKFFHECDYNFMESYKRYKKIVEVLESELTMESDKYQVYFQPIMSISENKFIYAEALSRLKNTELGDISPAEFIPAAEHSGLIERLGKLNFERVCQFISQNQDTVKAISVNFSVPQMMNPDISKNIVKLLEKYNVSPDKIIIELTESIIIDDYEVVWKRMNELTKTGIKFYLDDFGTGYSNFANVLRLPFSLIKFDRTFVLSMEQDKKIEVLMKNLISTFKDSGLHILVEGVETEEQDKLVKAAGVEYIQGFLYSKPVPEKEYLKILQKY